NRVRCQRVHQVAIEESDNFPIDLEQRSESVQRINNISISMFSVSSTAKLFWFQHQRKIDAFPLRDVKAANRERFPVLRYVWKNHAGNGHRQNDKPRAGHVHEFCSAAL